MNKQCEPAHSRITRAALTHYTIYPPDERTINSLISPPPPAPGSVAPPLDGQQPPQPSPLEAAAGEEGEGPGQAERGLSPSMYDKLRAEATTPFRSLRMFIYAGFGAGAGVGGFTAVTQLIKSVQGYVSVCGCGLLID